MQTGPAPPPSHSWPQTKERCLEPLDRSGFWKELPPLLVGPVGFARGGVRYSAFAYTARYNRRVHEKFFDIFPFFDRKIGRIAVKYRVQNAPKYMTKKEVKSTLKEKFLPVDFGLQG